MKIKHCKDCDRYFVDSIFCLTCGSANVENVKDDLPFKESKPNENE